MKLEEIEDGVEQKLEQSKDISASIMMQNWMQQSVLEEPYHNIKAVATSDDGQQSSCSIPSRDDGSSLQYLVPEKEI